MSTTKEAGFTHTLRIEAEHWKPSRTSMVLTLAQLQHLADDFDLGRIIRMDAPLTTQCNTTDPFQTGQGTFLLRARHDEEFVERVEFLHFLIDYLRKNRFPCAPVIRAKSGRSWTLWGERIVEIHGFIAHDPGIHRDWNRMFAAASALADLHRLLTAAASATTPVPPEMRNDVTPKQCWDMLLRAEESILMYRDVPELLQALNVLNHAKSLLEPLIPNYERTIGSLPWMMVHGDYHFWNVLYRADEIAAVVDYDFAQERERLFDIAYALQNVIMHMKSVHTGTLRHPKDLHWKNAAIWVDLYDAATHVPLSPVERKWLPKELLRIFLVSVATACNQENPVAALVALEPDLPLFEWISQQENLFT